MASLQALATRILTTVFAGILIGSPRITSYNVCYTKLLRAIGNVPALYEDSIHGRALSRSGLLVAPNCTSVARLSWLAEIPMARNNFV